MRVGALMSKPVVAVGPETLIPDVIAILRSRQISSVPVVDVDQRLLGIVSEADVLRSETSNARPAPQSVHQVMTRSVVSVPLDADAAQVALLMSRRALRHVPVTKSGRVVGMLSRRDLLGNLELTDGDIQSAVAQVLEAELGPRHPRVTIERGTAHLDLDEGAPGYHEAEVLASSVPGVLSVTPAQRR